jgi:hypothetical protein
MRAQTFSVLTCGVLMLGGALAACSSEPTTGGEPSNSAGSPAAGTTSSAAGSNGVAGSPGNSSGGAPSGSAGTTGFAGSPAQGGGGSGAGGAGGAAAGTGGGAGMTGSAGMAGSAGGGSTTIPDVKVVVYLDDYTGSWSDWANKIDFSKMTHLNLAFFTATGSNGWNESSGQSDDDVKMLVDKAHAAGVKVIASLGGGGGDSSVVNQYKDSSNDDALVSNLDAMLKRLNLDGADIDIEKESTGEVGTLYGTFVSKIIATLHPEGKIVSAAVAPYLQGYMPDDTLHSFDYVNIMTYSSNTSDYNSDVSLYTGDKGMAKTKVTLGIISESDQHTSTTTTKAIDGIAKGYGGVMLWDLAEDATGNASVYKQIQSDF